MKYDWAVGWKVSELGFDFPEGTQGYFSPSQCQD
jgi:hypothetical protein